MKNHKINILVIDDDKCMCKTLKELLTMEGYNVKYITKSKQTLEVLEEKAYHLIILDLEMPDIRGEDLLKEIKEFYPKIIVIIVTGHPSVDSAVQTLTSGAFDYIEKPFEIKDIITKIKKALKVNMLELDTGEKLNKNIGIRLKRIRREDNLTIKQLSERTGLSSSLISQIERAECSASISSLNKIVNVLNITLKELFEGD